MYLRRGLSIILILLPITFAHASSSWGSLLLVNGINITVEFVESINNGVEVLELYDQDGNPVLDDNGNPYSTDEVILLFKEDQGMTSGLIFFQALFAPQDLIATTMKELLTIEAAAWQDLLLMTVIPSSISQQVNMGTLTEINGQNYIFNASFTKYQTTVAPVKVIYSLSNFDVYPELLQSSYFFGQIKVYVCYRINDPEGQISLPGIQMNWNTLSNPTHKILKEIPNELEDTAWNNSVEVMVAIVDENMWGSQHIISTFILDSGTQYNIVETPHSLTAQQQNDDIFIQWAVNNSTGIDYYNVYRNTSSDFVIGNDSHIGTSSTLEYLDEAVGYGTTYYYKICSVNNDGILGNSSEQISVTPANSLILELVSYQNTSTTGTLLSWSGSLSYADGSPAEFGQIKTKILPQGYGISENQAEENGNFDFNWHSPSVPGEYQVEFNCSHNNLSLTHTAPLTIIFPLEYGHELLLTDHSLDSHFYIPGESINYSGNLSNTGIFDENQIDLYYQIISPTWDILINNTSNEGLLISENVELMPILTIPSNIDEGNYYLNVIADVPLGGLIASNKLFTHLHVNEVISYPQFRMIQYTLGLGDTTVIDGNSIQFISVNQFEPRFLINNAEVTIDLDDFWFNATENLIVNPESIYIDSTHTSVTIWASSSTGVFGVNRDEQVVYSGEAATFVIDFPAGYNIENNVEVFYGPDMTAVNDMSQSSYYNSIENSIYYTISTSNAVVGTYNFWIKIVDDSNWWIKKLSLEIIPTRELVFSSQEIINISYPGGPNLSGDVFSINYDINNLGSFLEQVSLQVLIHKGDTLLYRNNHIWQLNENEASNADFEWTTTGLSPGLYDVTAEIFTDGDIQINNTQLASTIGIDEIPLLNIEIINPNIIWNIGDVIEVSAQVQYNGNIVPDALLSAKISTPTNHVDEIALLFDATAELYKSEFIANIGGNYRVWVEGYKNRFLPGNDSTIYQVRVDMWATVNELSIKNGEYGSIYLWCGPIGNLHALAFDLLYNENIVRVESIAEGYLLNDNDDVNTSIIFTNQGDGRTILGISRLTTNWGAINFGNKQIAQICLKGLAEGNTPIGFENLGLIESDGISEIVTNLSNVTFEVENQIIPLIIQIDADSNEINTSGSANLYLGNTINVNTISGSINYNPDVLSIIDLQETPLFSEYGDVNTNFVYNNNQNQGIINFGLTRINADIGLVSNFGRLIEIEYSLIAPGESQIALDNVLLLDEDLEINYSSNIYCDTIKIFGMVPLDTANAWVNPDTTFIDTSEIFITDVVVNNASNVFAVATDIFYDPDIISVIDIIEGEFLNGEGSIPTQFIVTIDTIIGQIIIGLSRLEATGATTIGDTNLFSIIWGKQSLGATDISLTNFGLIISDGSTTIPVNVQGGYVTNALEPPILNNIYIEAIEDTPYILCHDTLSNYVDDQDTPDSLISWYIFSGNNTDVSFDTLNNNFILQFDENWFGIDTLLTIVTDDINFDTGFVQINVFSVNDNPYICTSLDTISIDEDDFGAIAILRLEDYFCDFDTIDVLIFTGSILDYGIDSMQLVRIDQMSLSWWDYGGKDYIHISRHANSQYLRSGTGIINKTLSNGSKDGDYNFISDLRNQPPSGTSLVIFPTENFNGLVRIAVTAFDDSLASITDTLVISIRPINDVPYIELNDEYSMSEDDTLLISIPVFDSDGDSLNYSSVIDTNAISITFYDSLMMIIPDSDWFGLSHVVITISDGDTSIHKPILITVNPINDSPSTFHILEPEDSTIIWISDDNLSEILRFIWNESIDVDGDSLAYNLDFSGSLMPLIQHNLFTNFVEYSYDTILTVINNNQTSSISGFWTVFVSDGTDTVYAANGGIYLLLDASMIGADNEEYLPAAFSINQNYPNPFNPTTTIQYELPERSDVQITIYDLLGREVIELVSETQDAGYKSVQWNATNVTSGMYFYKIRTGNYKQTRKMILLR